MTRQAWLYLAGVVGCGIWLLAILFSGHGAGDNHGVQPGPTIAYVIVGLVVFTAGLFRELSRNRRNDP